MNQESTIAEDLVEEPPTFDVIPLSPAVRKAVDAVGYTHPTPVQKAVFESVASGRDVVVQARTGTGKTAAFGLPLVDRIVKSNVPHPQVLVLSPTRELALQISRELEKLAQFNGVTCTAVYGGAAMQPQIDAIRRGAQIIAGTPGRVLDHLERRTLDPATIVALVLDESDEMLSMGFLPQITKIMEQLPQKHQTLLFSATLPPDVRRIAETRLVEPEFITLSGDHIGALSIEHYVYRSAGQKADELIQIIEIENPESAIIFCNTREQTKRISLALTKKGFAADWLNADLAQNDREKVMRATREGKLRFLVCTDVAARGIDISHLTHVINADFPESTENYVHRTGRTGRAGKTGTAISLIAPQDVGNLYMLRLTYKIFPVERDLPRAGDLQTRREADLVDFLYQAFSRQPGLDKDRSLARRVLQSELSEIIVAGLLRDHLGGHPRTEAEAGEARRSAAPPEVKDAKKKGEKKKKKGEKKKKRQHPDELSGSETAETAELSADPSAFPAPLAPAAQAPLDTAATELPKRSRSVDLEAEEPQVVAGERRPSGPALEVIAAADLLTAHERAVLRGDFVDEAEALPSDEALLEGAPLVREATSSSRKIFVDLGRDDNVSEEDFLDTLADNGFPIGEVSYIDLRDRHTFLGIPARLFDQALSSLDQEDIGGLVAHAEAARPPKRRARGRHH